MPQISPLSFRSIPSSKPMSASDGSAIAAANEGREFSDAEVMAAMHAYMERTGWPFLTWGEVLEVLRELGDREF